MSPEEFQLGAEIDERSNVYCMGATAFQLMGGGRDHSYDKWRTTEKLYKVVLKAISPDKVDRYQTIDEYMRTWNATL